MKTRRASPPDLPADTETAAVKAVIAADTAAYLGRDRAAWDACWIKDDRFASFMECGGLVVSRGYDAFRTTVFEAMDDHGGASKATVQRENYVVHVSGETAWAVFDQIITRGDDDPLAPPNLSHNVRLLLKTERGWRIVFHGVWAQRGRDADGPAVEVDGAARIIWANEAAQCALDGRAGLFDSRGTLRAARPQWDRELRDAIRRAAELTALVPYRGVMGLTGAPVSFPVVLGEDDGGRMMICRVRVSDFRLYVGFGADAGLSRRLAMARVVFGLSEAQAKLAENLADGLSLAESAARAGISVNTARTHLNRMFDKVGVRSQTALLRMILAGD